MRKRYYIASGAQVNYRGTLVNSRTGVHPDAEMGYPAIIESCVVSNPNGMKRQSRPNALLM